MTDNVTKLKQPLSREFPLRVGGRRYSFGKKPTVLDLHTFLGTLQMTRKRGGTEDEVLADYLNGALVAGDELQPEKDDEHYLEQLMLFFADLASERITEAQYSQVLDLVRQHYTGNIQNFLDFDLSDEELEKQAAEIKEAQGEVDEAEDEPVDAAGN